MINAVIWTWPKCFGSSKDLGLMEGLRIESVLWFGEAVGFQAKIQNETRAR